MTLKLIATINLGDEVITDEQIKQIFVDAGFRLSHIKEVQKAVPLGSTYFDEPDLKPYVYDAARALIAKAQEVSDLRWFEQSGCWRSAGGLDNYDLSARGFDFLIWIADSHFGQPIARINGLDAAKAFCNEHNRKRALAQLKYGGE